MKTITVNRKAYHSYHIEDTLEAGIVLMGTEIKSIRAGRINLSDAYARPERGEMWLFNAHIARYGAGGYNNHEPTRPRKLLLHKDQISMLSGRAAQKGLTLVPLRMYIKNHVAKVELGLAKGKKLYDKRQALARRDAEMEMRRATKRRI